jgi:sec-independent protein translocase protein TatC
LVTQITISSYSPSAPDLDGGAPGEGSAADNASAGETGADQGSAQAGSADTPPGHIAILEQNPAEPVDGQAWVKVPERELRIHLGEQTYRFLPFQNRSMVQPMMDVNQYLGFVTFLALGVVIAFQLPVVMLILGWSGLVSPRWLAQYRKYCIFGCFVLGTLFTPADPISMLMLAMPLWGLFELGILLMRLTYRPSPTFDDMGWD